MEREHASDFTRKKKDRKSVRKINTALFLLRCIQCGIRISELDYLTVGMVNDIFVDSRNDDYQYPLIATQADIDRL